MASGLITWIGSVMLSRDQEFWLRLEVIHLGQDSEGQVKLFLRAQVGQMLRNSIWGREIQTLLLP